MSRRLKLKTTLWHRPSTTTKKEEGVPIFCRITVPGSKKTELDTGLRIQNGDWDKARKQVLPRNKTYKKLNDELDTLIADLEAHYTVLLKKYEKVTSLMVKNDYNDLPVDQDLTSQKKQNQTLLKAADSLIDDFEEMVNEGIRSHYTLKQWRATRKKIEEFIYYRATGKFLEQPSQKGGLRVVHKKGETKLTEQKEKVYDISLNSLDLKFLTEFKRYLMVKRKPKKLQLSATNKQLKNLKQVLTNAVTEKWINVNPFANYKSTSDEKEVIPLELHQVEKMYLKKGLVKRLEEVRDAFVFQCFTGFAYQDLFELGPQHIKKVGRDYWLIKPRGKTKALQMVPILPIVMEIIRKYQNHPYCRKRKRLLPVDSNSRYNGYTKELEVIMKFDIRLNTHRARHTFADLMLNMGVPLEVVSRMLGHRSIRTTQRYCRINKRRIANCMKMVSNKLFTNTGKIKKIDKETYEYALAA